MKHLLSGVAIAAALALSTPAGAQGNAGGASSMPNETSATPAKHRHARTVHHMTHGRPAMHTSAMGGNNEANQLNRQELSRLQAGSSMAPSPTMGGPGPASSTMGGPGPMSSNRSPGPKPSGSGYVPSEPGAGAAAPVPGPAATGPGTGGPR